MADPDGMRPGVMVAFALLASGDRAHADRWFVAEAPVAVPISDPQAATFRFGAMPAVGVYTETGWLALGLRMRAGVLRNGPAPGAGFEDPGTGGLTTAGVAVRATKLGGWVELVAGGGVTGADVVPSVEAGIGWSLAVGSVDVGPSLRYLRAINREPMTGLGTAGIALFGIDIRIGRERARRPRQPAQEKLAVAVAAPPPAPAPAIEPAPAPAIEPAPAPAIEPAPPLEPAPEPPPAPAIVEPPASEDEIVVVDDRIILEERVLFKFNRARVRTRARPILRKLVDTWNAHPEWLHMTIEGHTDVRGSDEHNLWLSRERARRVRKVMIELGCPADRLTAVGFGRTRPRDTHASEAAYRRNRRVEFAIDRREVDTAAGQP